MTPDRTPLDLLQQGNLPRMVKLVLHQSMQHVIERVVCAFLARNQFIEARVRESCDCVDQFLMDAPQICQSLVPCVIAGIADGREVLCVGEFYRASAQSPQDRTVPGGDVERQLPDRVCAWYAAFRRLCRRDTFKDFKQGIAMPCI